MLLQFGDQSQAGDFDKRLGVEEKGTDLLSDFFDQVYLPWSKTNKKSWRDDTYTAPMIKQYFEGKALREISAQLVEQFKNDRLNTPTKKGTARRPATVNRELTLLSSAFSLAIKYDKAESNPCSKVDLFTLDNLRYQYLLPEEEPRLMAQLNGPRAHLKPAVIVALGTGMRMGEQFTNEAPSGGLSSQHRHRAKHQERETTRYPHER